MINDTYRYNSVDVAMYIVAYANDRRFGINMTKLQKLLYISYGIFLAVKSYRLTNEHPQAWPYGPVFPTTRNKLLHVDFDSIRISDKRFDGLKKDGEFMSLIALVFQSFGTWTAASLTEWSHRDGTPWSQTVDMKSFKWGDVISDGFIYPFFKAKLSYKDGSRK